MNLETVQPLVDQETPLLPHDEVQRFIALSPAAVLAVELRV